MKLRKESCYPIMFRPIVQLNNPVALVKLRTSLSAYDFVLIFDYGELKNSGLGHAEGGVGAYVASCYFFPFRELNTEQEWGI